MEYGITLRGNSTENKSLSATKENNQNYGSESRNSCRPFFQSLEILTLTSQYIQSLMKCLSHIMKIYTLNFTVHGINMVNKPQLHKTAAIPEGVYYLSIKIFNELPEYTVVLVVDRKCFVSTLEKYLFNKPFYSLEEFVNE